MFGTLRWLSNIGLSSEASDLFIVIYNLFHDMFDQYNFVLKAVFMKWKFTTVMRSFVFFVDVFDLNAICPKYNFVLKSNEWATFPNLLGHPVHTRSIVSDTIEVIEYGMMLRCYNSLPINAVRS